ncbi:MAG: M20/M25/M40 family metallo-hydrolase [Emergencia sp.]
MYKKNDKEILRDLVAIDTVADNNNEEIMDYLQEFLESYGFSVKRIKNEETGKEVLTGQYGEDPAVGFMGHTDTVAAADGWVTDPFRLTEKDGMLYGLGACDMKGGIASALAAIAATDLKSLKRGIKVVWTYDEEIMFNGIKDYVNSGEPFAEHMIVCEPTDLIPMIGSKGLLEYIFTFRGLTTHSSTPVDGKSSNKNAVRFLNKMQDFEEELRKNPTEMFGVPYPTMNIGIINGGTSINKVPDLTTVYLDFRICNSEVEYPVIRKAVDDALAPFDASYEIINDIPSFDKPSRFVSLYEEKTGNKGVPFFGITEGSFFDGDKVIIGPGPMTAHEINEHISVESLEKTTALYGGMIEALCK